LIFANDAGSPNTANGHRTCGTKFAIHAS